MKSSGFCCQFSAFKLFQRDFFAFCEEVVDC